MKKRYFVATFLTLVLYNVFLIHRDKQLFDSYDDIRNKTSISTATN